jgi:uncharacterized paraquat-inducible protein A
MTQWCERCERAEESDTCEVCGEHLISEQQPSLPWTWKFMIASTIVYVIWRIYQLISWLLR